MSLLKFLAILLSLNLIPFQSYAQEISSFQWKNRILLLMADDIANEMLDNQISSLRISNEDLAERKVEVILLIKDKSYMGLNFGEPLIDNKLLKIYKGTTSPFEMVLIGLDGTIKKRYTEYQSAQEIINIIDRMPMRQSEIKRGN